MAVGTGVAELTSCTVPMPRRPRRSALPAAGTTTGTTAFTVLRCHKPILEVGHGNFSIKGGHFFTLVGYEVVTAPDNFFYSHALTMFNSEPFTHTGARRDLRRRRQPQVYGGWTLGWDTGFRQFNDGSSWLGGFSYSLGDNITFTYISTAGNFGWRGKDAYSPQRRGGRQSDREAQLRTPE